MTGLELMGNVELAASLPPSRLGIMTPNSERPRRVRPGR